MVTLRLGVSLHDLGAPVDEALLAALAQSGIATTELLPTRLFAGDAAMRVRLRAALRAAGIRTASVHAAFGGALDVSSLDDAVQARGLAAWREGLASAREFGAEIVVVHPSSEPIGDAERSRRFDRTRAALAVVADECLRVGVRLAVELLPRTCLGHTAEELLALIAGLDPAVAGCCLDVNHLMDRAARLPETVHELERHLFTLHLSDYDGVDEKHWLPGSGVIDWRAFLAALGANGYGGPFNYEAILPGDTPMARLEVLRQNFAWMQSLV